VLSLLVALLQLYCHGISSMGVCFSLLTLKFLCNIITAGLNMLFKRYVVFSVNLKVL